MLTIGIVTSTVRPGRVGLRVAQEVFKLAKAHGKANYEIIDIKDYNLPLFNNQHRSNQASEADLKRIRPWLDKLDQLDAYIFITAEYNRSIPSNLKNALDYVDVQWQDKVGGIVSYGEYGGVSAADHLRVILATYPMVMVSHHPALSIEEDIMEDRIDLPEKQIERIQLLLDQVIRWAEAMNYYKENILTEN